MSGSVEFLDYIIEDVHVYMRTHIEKAEVNKRFEYCVFGPACSMRSMRGNVFSVVEGPCKRYAMAPFDSWEKSQMVLTLMYERTLSSS
jgi:hypothetical protein